MPLLTIADLDQPQEVLAPYIQRAQGLSEMYFANVAQDQNDSYNYPVEIFGTRGRSSGIHASEVSKCMRQVVYCIAGTERQPPVQGADVNMLMRFRLGTAVHSMIQSDWHRIAAKSGGAMHFQDEVRVGPELGGVAAVWNIHSSCDGLFTLYDAQGNPEVRVGLEIKTISADGFSKLKSPMSDHIEQTTIYMATIDIPVMWILYYNKSNSNITSSFSPWLFQFDKERWSNDLEIRFARCTHMAQMGQLPDGTEGMHCRWCSFAYTCQPKTLQLRSANRHGPRLSGGMKR